MPEEKKPKEYKVVNGTYYDARTPDLLVEALETARLAGKRVRIFIGDTETGVDWLDEYDVLGRISRSMGPIKIPILIKNSRSMGGGGILDHCILKLIFDGHVQYQAPNYQAPTFTIMPPKDSGFVSSVYVNGKLHAQFRKQGQAEKWIAFMKGERMAK